MKQIVIYDVVYNAPKVGELVVLGGHKISRFR